MHKVKIIGAGYGLQKIEMTKILREKCSLNLAEAKGCTDVVLEGKIISFEIADYTKSKELADALENIGSIVEIEVVE